MVVRTKNPEGRMVAESGGCRRRRSENRLHQMISFPFKIFNELSTPSLRRKSTTDLRVGLLCPSGPYCSAGQDLPRFTGGAQQRDPLVSVGLIVPVDPVAPRRTRPVIAGGQGMTHASGVAAAIAADVAIPGSDMRVNQIAVAHGTVATNAPTYHAAERGECGITERRATIRDGFCTDILRTKLVTKAVNPDGEIGTVLEIRMRVPAAMVLATAHAALLAVQGCRDAAARAVDRASRRLSRTIDRRDVVLAPRKGLKPSLQRC